MAALYEMFTLPCMRYQMPSCIRHKMLPCMRFLRLPCMRSQILCRVGQSCIHTLSLTVCLVTFLPKTLYIHRLNMVLADPILVWPSYLVICNLTFHIRNPILVCPSYLVIRNLTFTFDFLSLCGRATLSSAT